MLIKVHQEIFQKYPKTQIGYVVADVCMKNVDLYVEKLKGYLADVLKKNNIKNNNYATHPHISGWREVFQTFGVTHKTNRSSLEALVRRTVAGEKTWNVSNVVDLYNCCSVLSMMPMGGYDVEKIKNNIYLRFGTTNDRFEAIGIKDEIKIEQNHVVYSDDEKVLCWLWNYRDSKHSAIDQSSKRCIFFLDSAFELKHINMAEAIDLFTEGLSKIGSSIRKSGILSAETQEINVSFENIENENVTVKQGTIDKLLKNEWTLNGVSLVQAKKPTAIYSHTSRHSYKPKLEDIITPFHPVSVDKIANIQNAIQAAATGDISTLNEILNYDPKLISLSDWYNNNLLIHAIRGDHIEIVKYLIELNIDIHHKNNGNETAIDVAKRFSSSQSIKFLESKFLGGSSESAPRFTVDKLVFDTLPGVRIFNAVIHDIDQNQESIKSACSDLLSKSCLELINEMKQNKYENAQSHPRVAAWRKAFKDLGVSKKFVSSAESLVKRVLKSEGSMKSLGPLVDFYNSYSIRYAIPFGGFDLDELNGKQVSLRKTNESDMFKALDEETYDTKVSNEYSYVLEPNLVITRHVNYKQSREGLITNQTKNVVFMAEVLNVITNEQLNNICQDFQATCKSIFNKEANIIIVNKDNPSITWSAKQFGGPESTPPSTSSKTISENNHVLKITSTDQTANVDVYNAICSFLNENNVGYRIEEHEPPYTCPTEGKSILMKIDETYHLFAYTASRRLNSKLIKKHFGCKKMRFATSEELFDKFKLVPGSVPTFGEPILQVKIFLDTQMITTNKEITFSMGTVSHYAIMKMADYLKIAKYETFEFTDESPNE